MNLEIHTGRDLSLLAAAAAIVVVSIPIGARAEDSLQKRVQVYGPGPEITAPILVPSTDNNFDANNCSYTVKGQVRLALVVDVDGRAKNLFFVKPAGNEVDELALYVVSTDRFTPGVRGGTPVAVAQEMDLKLKGCVKFTGSRTTIRVASMPDESLHPPEPFATETELGTGSGIEGDPADREKTIHKVGGGVSAPVPLLTPEAEFSDEARRKKINGACMIQLIVDRQGMPRETHLVRPAGYGLDEKALAAVMRYRFKPGMMNGAPIPVRIVIQVNFRLG